MRGEHTSAFFHVSLHPGSSPHARGTQSPQPERTVRRGIIPACAGNTSGTTDSTATYGDHPRMRGEHHTPVRKRRRRQGSSPHARGTLVVRLPTGDGDGIIPACAGNTRCRCDCRLHHGDHPRMRGEHIANVDGGPDMQGSSPHARGTLPIVKQYVFRDGIIPACAGNAAASARPRCQSRDHPRMRGEHQLRADSGGGLRGIIPACAGNTDVSLTPRPEAGDHPRMRGEHENREPNDNAVGGSSPHARGTPVR